ncbi:MAG: phosphatidylglycerophosphatase A [Aestuariivita sp.]|nr:phosphatidylglycerophosphatase A [Aestuariivita sp.]MCY4201797.1 phosphatidylglycerophosphatase A [Aestuariivita sp.]MCY4288478.1 phosphatidylglycerophosphatase A [Aestuariivita sp.]MCY4347062.1 phosphatidylglycerophosphatase A [Aestuariivita sp.]
MARLTATFFGVGYLSPGSGTLGSGVALVLAGIIHVFAGFPGLVVATICGGLVGWWSVAALTRDAESCDRSEFVIDEVVGQWLTLWPISWIAMNEGVPLSVLWFECALAFLLFRLFDILKPGPVGWIDQHDGPLAVMSDDVVAAIFAAVLTTLITLSFIDRSI